VQFRARAWMPFCGYRLRAELRDGFIPCRGVPLPEACERAKGYVLNALLSVVVHRGRLSLTPSTGEVLRVLVTGSAGHLGEALMRSIADSSHAVGIDIKALLYALCGIIADRSFVERCMRGVQGVLHTATSTAHIETHSRQDFVDTNVSGTLNLLEVASRRVDAFVYRVPPVHLVGACRARRAAPG